MTPTAASLIRRDALRVHRAEIDALLETYGATAPRVFGSTARGTAVSGSDVDLLVDLKKGVGNPLLRIAGLSEELSDLLGVHVDVVAPELLRDGVSDEALADARPL